MFFFLVEQIEASFFRIAVEMEGVPSCFFSFGKLGWQCHEHWESWLRHSRGWTEVWPASTRNGRGMTLEFLSSVSEKVVGQELPLALPGLPKVSKPSQMLPRADGKPTELGNLNRRPPSHLFFVSFGPGRPVAFWP